ncbi:centrosomin isoform X2 [Tenebrio molitor]|uniref:centrosomin isoform X2 n=1 Tax=Tenebrio molitor TaxID=7067 RepID=UPI0036248A5D
MAREYLKAVIENTIMEEKSELDVTESCEDLDIETASESNHSMSLRSPGGPMRGRSVKEFEEQLANLKKENFNLKLRIYFLEERMGCNFNLDKENVVKKNVELMVEVESLRKEIQEKHDLLCQAVKAMELEDEEHKKTVSEKDEVLTECHQEIESLKTQLLDIKAESEILSAKSYQSGPAELFSSQPFSTQDCSSAFKELQEKVKSLEEELGQEKQNNAAIQIVLDQNDSRIKSLTSQLEDANSKLAYREEELHDMTFRLDEAKGKCQGLHKMLVEKAQALDEMSSENEELRKRHALVVADLEKERKRYEKLKASSEQKTSDLQNKLETSLQELKKSQELVVSKSPGRRPGNTDADSFSVQKPATPPGSPQKDTFLFPTVPSPVITPTSSPSPSINFNEGNGVDLKHIIEQLKTERDLQNQKIVKLKAEQMKACKIIKSMIDSRNKTNEEIAVLKEKNEELERELEEVASKVKPGSDKGSDVSCSSGSTSNENSMAVQSGELVEHYKALTDELEEKNRILMATMTEKDNQMKSLQEQYEEMFKNNKEKEEHIVDLEFELLTVTQDKNVKLVETEDQKTVDYYAQQLKEKEKEIEILCEKLQRRNCDLQGLVNNELWEKNRQIEKLQKKQTASKEQEIEKLQNDLKTKEEQLDLIKEKISELGIEIDLEGGGVSVERNLQIELEKSEKLRLEANEVCGVLSRRLEELAIFLDSLLKQKSVLGFLGNKENKRLRQIIDQSLDLSRSFTMSMLVNPEQSLMQLTNISSLLNNTEQKFDEEEEEEDDLENTASRLSILPSAISLTYRSHLFRKDSDDNSPIVQTLRQQIVNLKYELQLRDAELGKMDGGNNFTEISSEKDENNMARSTLNTTSTTLKYKSDNQSESEAWSEPDRTVSRARIGLLDGSLRSNSSKKTISNTSTDSTEEEDVNRSSRTSSKKCVLNDSRNTILDLHKQVCELDQKLTDKEIAYYEATKTNNKLKQEVSNLEIKLSDKETKLRDAENKKVEAESRVAGLKKEKDDLLETLDMKDKELQNKINTIELEKIKALDVAKEAEETARIAKNEMQTAEIALRAIQKEMSDLEESLRNEYENQLTERVHEVEEESLKKISQIQSAAELEIKSLHNTLKQLQFEYSVNYVKKCELEEAVEEVERLKSEIESLEVRMEELKDEEQRAKDKLADCEEKINLLRNDLDNATLQYSEAVLDKTKIANEKALIEQELNRSVLREVDSKKRLDEVENELYELRQSHMKQLSSLQMHKSKLEVRVSELESSNAELHNRLIKIQAGCGDHVSSSSLPNTPNFVNQIVSFRRQHSENSGYTSEDHLLADDVRGSSRSFNRSNQNFDIERNEANSSPDLGIESDHGRFSSLETHLNVQRPLLQTLELTESMNNLLDAETNRTQEVDCDSAHCCQKTLEMAHENSDLKRKLLRTRRALEETVTQLTLANQRKKQVEKTICKQIHKTSQVLRKAKANLDSGSETDVYKK